VFFFANLWNWWGYSLQAARRPIRWVLNRLCRWFLQEASPLLVMCIVQCTMCKLCGGNVTLVCLQMALLCQEIWARKGIRHVLLCRPCTMYLQHCLCCLLCLSVSCTRLKMTLPFWLVMYRVLGAKLIPLYCTLVLYFVHCIVRWSVRVMGKLTGPEPGPLCLASSWVDLSPTQSSPSSWARGGCFDWDPLGVEDF
jgi:hypothetical protein